MKRPRQVFRGLRKSKLQLMVPSLEIANNYCDQNDEDLIPRAVWFDDGKPEEATVVGWTIIPRKEAV